VRPAVVALCILVVSSGASAQRSRGQSSDPNYWLSVGEAQQSSWSVTDGAGKARWDFASTKTITANLDKTLTKGVTIGLQGTRATLPMAYVGADSSTIPAVTHVSQVLGMLHIVHPTSLAALHSILELGAGSTLYSNFIRTDTNTQFGPATTDADFTWAYGVGAGYSLSKRISVDVIRETTKAYHQATGLVAGDPTNASIGETRIIGRIGF
jgi:opacity protein-like surface antigen